MEGYEQRPDPMSARTPEAFMRTMRRYRLWSGGRSPTGARSEHPHPGAPCYEVILMFVACGPFLPSEISKVTAWPSRSVLMPSEAISS